MNLPSFEIAGVLASHELSKSTRRVDSVVPEVTEIPVIAEDLQAFLGNVTVGNFRKNGLFFDRPVNVVRGINFSFLAQEPGVEVSEKSPVNTDDASLFAEMIQPVDAHFRGWSGIDDDVVTSPVVNLIAGKFEGRRSDVNGHFDFGARLPQVSYKIYFEGDPAFSSVYYPGQYKLPSKFTEVSRALAGTQPNAPTPMYKWKNRTEHIMPAQVVCVEPWNAYHSGPRNKDARGELRGILSIAYDLSKLDITKAEMSEDSGEVSLS